MYELFTTMVLPLDDAMPANQSRRQRQIDAVESGGGVRRKLITTSASVGEVEQVLVEARLSRLDAGRRVDGTDAELEPAFVRRSQLRRDVDRRSSARVASYDYSGGVESADLVRAWMDVPRVAADSALSAVDVPFALFIEIDTFTIFCEHFKYILVV